MEDVFTMPSSFLLAVIYQEGKEPEEQNLDKIVGNQLSVESWAGILKSSLAVLT